jgi:hypothetical protein
MCKDFPFDTLGVLLSQEGTGSTPEEVASRSFLLS